MGLGCLPERLALARPTAYRPAYHRPGPLGTLALAGGFHCLLLSFLGSRVAPSLLLAWLRHVPAQCPGLAHLRHKLPFILPWYSLAKMLNPGLLEVASNSIESLWLSF